MTTYYKRIGDNELKGDFVDGSILRHTDINEIERVTKAGINANYEDIQKIKDGTIEVKTAETIDSVSVSRYDGESGEVLQNVDTKVPTSKQVYQYLHDDEFKIDYETQINNLPKINGVVLIGNKSTADLKIATGISTMPVASADYVDMIIQYIGATTGDYTRGYFYRCKAQGTSPETYAWERIDVQPVSGGGGGVSVYDDLTGRPKVNGVTLVGDTNNTLDNLGIQAKITSSNKLPLELVEDTDDMATKTWVNEQGFLTEHQSLEDYVTNAGLSTTLENYVLNSTLNSRLANLPKASETQFGVAKIYVDSNNILHIDTLA